MAKSILYMSMSLDRFITGRDDGRGNGLGTGGHRLHAWLGEPVSEPPYFDPATGGTTTGCRSSYPRAAPRRSRRATGSTTVMVHGANLAQSLLREGLLDELEIHLIPVVLGDGRPLFCVDRVELELTRVLDAPGVTHLRYRVRHGA